MRKGIGLLAAVVGIAALSAAYGCDTINEATSNQVMLSQLLSTPDESVAGKSVPGKVVANVFLGTHDVTNTTNPPSPTTGAQVHVEFNGQSVTIPETGNGNYTLESNAVTDAGLAYQPGTTYRFVAVVGSTTFAENVVAPEREEIVEFHQGLLAPDSGVVVYDDGGTNVPLDGGYPAVMVSAGQNLTLTRPPPDGDRNIALTVVTPIDTQNGPQQPTFTDPPLDAQGLLTVLVDPSKYEQDTIVVDGSKAWSTCSPADYLIAVTGMKKGSTEGTNLFLGSTALAGSADAAPARCQ